MAEDAKAKGNAAFSAGRFEEGIEHFTEGIALAPENHVLYSNRSACYASLQRYEEALQDAEKVIELKSDWPKGYSRKAAALQGLRRIDEAIETFNAGLVVQPDSEPLKQGLEAAKKQKADQGPASGLAGLADMFTNPQIWSKLLTDPQTRPLLQQPDFVEILRNIQKNPSLLGQYLNDQRIMQVLGAVLGMNMPSKAGAPENGSAENGAKEEPVATPEAANVAEGEPKEEKPGTEDVPMEPETSVDGTKTKALECKERGNAHYKKKEFEEAIACYNEAIELYDGPESMSFLTNRAAVYFEMGKYDECIKDCDDAYEKGQSAHADFKVLGRALTRKGNALKKMGRLEEAVKTYQDALTEHRNADTLKRLNDTEKEIKVQAEQAYLSPEIAEEERGKGNQCFKDQNYPDAVKHYSEAIKRDPTDYRLYSNRAACYTKLTAFYEALKDADKCIELNPQFSKGYSRKGHVQFFMKEYNKALETYQRGLEVDPENAEMKDGVRRCVEAINRFNRGDVSEEEMKERQAKAMDDPEIQQILQDPVMRQVLQDFQTNPQAAAQHSKDPSVMERIQKLVAAGIVQVR